VIPQQRTFLRVLPSRWRRKPAGIDTERSYVIVTLCMHVLRTNRVRVSLQSIENTKNALCHWVELFSMLHVVSRTNSAASLRQPRTNLSYINSPLPMTGTSSIDSPLSPSITPSVFHSRLKTFLFLQILPAVALSFLLWNWLPGLAGLLLPLLIISVFFSFSLLLTIYFFGSVR